MLRENLKEDLNKAIKEKDQIECLVLRTILAEIFNKEKEKKYEKQEESLTDEDVLAVLIFEAKKRRESILEFVRGGREDLAEKEKAELRVLERYLPEQLSEEEIRKMIKDIIEELNPEGIRDMGKVMNAIMVKVKGRADGSLVNKIVKESLDQDRND